MNGLWTITVPIIRELVRHATEWDMSVERHLERLFLHLPDHRNRRTCLISGNPWPLGKVIHKYEHAQSTPLSTLHCTGSIENSKHLLLLNNHIFNGQHRLNCPSSKNSFLSTSCWCCNSKVSSAVIIIFNKHCEVLVSCSDWVDWIDFIELHACNMLSKAVISTASRSDFQNLGG